MRTYLRAKLQIGSTALFFFPELPQVLQGLHRPVWPSCADLLFICFTLPSAVLNYQEFGLDS
jgi:hypothetical protein